MLHSQHEKRLTTHDVDAHTDTKRKITRPANKHTHGVSRWIGEEAHAQSTAEGAGGKQRGRGGRRRRKARAVHMAISMD
jgi:hypothetical protein